MLWIIISYFIVGVLFGVSFVLAGAKRIDPKAATAKLSLRVLWMPAAMVLWPILLRRLFVARSDSEGVEK